MGTGNRWIHGQFQQKTSQIVINWSSSSEDEGETIDSKSIFDLSPIINRQSKPAVPEIECAETQCDNKYEIESISSQETPGIWLDCTLQTLKVDNTLVFIESDESNLSPIIGKGTKMKYKKFSSKSILETAKKYEIQSDSSQDNIEEDKRDEETRDEEELSSNTLSSNFTDLSGVSSVLYTNVKNGKKCKYKPKGFAIKAHKTLKHSRNCVEIWKHELSLAKNDDTEFRKFTIRKVVGEFLINFVLAEENVLVLLGDIDVSINYGGRKLLVYPPFTSNETIYEGNRMDLLINVNKYIIL